MSLNQTITNHSPIKAQRTATAHHNTMCYLSARDYFFFFSLINHPIRSGRRWQHRRHRGRSDRRHIMFQSLSTANASNVYFTALALAMPHKLYGDMLERLRISDGALKT